MWGIVGATFVITYATFLRGYRLFFPDSRYYLAMAYLFSGNDPETARQLTTDFASQYGIDIPPVDELFGWGLVQPRVVYPVLSIPFLALFGPFGMAVVPLIAAIVMTVLLTIVVSRRYGNVAATGTLLLVNASILLMSFHTGMLTESLSSVFTIVALMAAWRWLKTPRPWLLVAMGALTAASAFTRQATLIMAGAFVMAWLLGSLVERKNSRWMLPALVVAGTSVGCQVLQSIVFPSFSQLDQFLKQAGADTLGEALLQIPAMLARIIVTDIGSMMGSDRTLLFLIAIALIGMVVFWRRPEAHLLFGAVLAVLLYNVTNGTPTQFRYATPGLVFYVLVAALVLSRTATVTRRAIDRTRSADDALDPAPPR